MRSISGSLLAHMQGTTLTMCLCFKVVRLDGQGFYFTGHDANLSIDGNTYRADLSFTAAEAEAKSGLSVDNTELILPLADAGISKADVLANTFYQATLDVFWVNWADLGMGKMYEAKGWKLGKATLKEFQVVFEVRSLASLLSAPILDVISPDCPYTFGVMDNYRSHCPANLNNYKVSTSVNAVSSTEPRRVFQCGAQGNIYLYGKVTFTSGNNAGYSGEVESAGPWLNLLVNMPFNIQIGDSVDVWRGCDKTIWTCKELGFDIDFGGEPYCPSKDLLLQYKW